MKWKIRGGVKVGFLCNECLSCQIINFGEKCVIITKAHKSRKVKEWEIRSFDLPQTLKKMRFTL